MALNLAPMQGLWDWPANRPHSKRTPWRRGYCPAGNGETSPATRFDSGSHSRSGSSGNTGKISGLDDKPQAFKAREQETLSHRRRNRKQDDAATADEPVVAYGSVAELVDATSCGDR